LRLLITSIMVQNTENGPRQSDEIDLTQFFKWIGTGFKNIGNGTILALAGLRNIFFNNRIFFAGIILLGLVFGAAYSELLKKKFYKTTLVLSCDYLNNEILENTIEKLNLLCAEEKREGLSELLQIDNETAKNIQKFEFKPFVSEDDVVEMEVLREQLNNVAKEKKDLVEKVLTKLKIVNKNAYQLSVLVYDPEIVKPLEKALINYFRNNEYIKRRIAINKVNLASRKQKLVSDSRKLDSLKSVLYQNYQTLGKTSRGSNNVILGEESLTNPLDVFKQDLELNKEILEIDQKLYVEPDFELVDGFTTFKEPESASLPKILIIAFFISWLMGYLIIGAWRLDQLLASYNTKKAEA
jgi:hypothetical protein